MTGRATSPPSGPPVSVITPVYNEEKHLAQCVESILAQTYSNWDLTIVNNRSTDRSLEIAEELARRDPRIRVVTTPELYSITRNHSFATRQISPDSKYCKVVQGDDWIFPECLERMVAAAEAHPTVGIVGAVVLSSKGIRGSDIPYPCHFAPGREIARKSLLREITCFGSPSSLLLRSEIVRKRDPFYRIGALHADTEACYEILQEWDFAYIHQILTFFRTDNISTSSRVLDLEPYPLDHYICVRRYGPVLLDAAENAAAQKRFERAYYGRLGARAIGWPGKRFWDYQRLGLATIDERLRWRLVVKYLIGEIVDIAFNPKNTLVRIARKLFGAKLVPW